MLPTDQMTSVVRRVDARWERLGEQVVVLDRARDRAHSLDGLVAIVWTQIDGERTGLDLVGAVTVSCEREVSLDEVRDALTALRDAGLLAEHGIDRRRLFKLGAGAAIGGAALVTIGLPTPAAALSTGGPAPEFLNTAGYDLNSADGPGDGTTTPYVQSLTFDFTGSGTQPDLGYITPSPNLNDAAPIEWLDLSVEISLVEIVDFLDDPDRTSFLQASTVRVQFFDSTQSPALFLGQAYFPDPVP